MPRVSHYDDVFEHDLYDVSTQVLNYLEGTNLAIYEEEITTLRAKHGVLGFDVIEKVFKGLNLGKSGLGYDIRDYYGCGRIRFDLREIYRIYDEVYPVKKSLQTKFRLKNFSPDPTKLDETFNKILKFINIKDEDKGRLQASLSILCTQVVRDVLEFPTDRSRFALVLYGMQGSGKTTFNTTLCKVFMGEDVSIQKNDLNSGFDSEVLLNPVCRIEDLDYTFRDQINNIKSLITNITETTINVKYKPEQKALIRTTILMDTNHDFINIIKVDGEQRRFCIFEFLPPENEEDFDEEGLEKALREFFELHTVEYYYDVKKLMRINRILSDTAEEALSYIREKLESRYEILEIAHGTITPFKGLKYSKCELKSQIKGILEESNSLDNFVSDLLLQKIIQRFFYIQYDSHAKSDKFHYRKTKAIKDSNTIDAGNAGNAGKKINPLREKENQISFVLPAIPALPAKPQDFIPQRDLYSDIEWENLSFEKYILDYRDKYIKDVILHENRPLFYDIKIGDEESEDVKNIVEFQKVRTDSPVLTSEDSILKQVENVVYDGEDIDTSSLKTSERTTLHFSTVIEDKYNISFPRECTIKDVEDIKMIVPYDNIGGRFLGDLAKNENFISTNLLLVDIDSHHGEDLSNIEKIDSLGLEYYRVTSKSGKGYHFYFPLSHEVEGEDIFKKTIDSLYEFIESVGLTPDKACRNPSRKFFGTSYENSAIHYEGEKFNVIKALKNGYKTIREVKNNPSGFHKVSSNRDLTDQYYNGKVNHGHVVDDLPHIINYLITLSENNRSFYSNILGCKIDPNKVIDKILLVVSYNPTHVSFIQTLRNNRYNTKRMIKQHQKTYGSNS